MRVEEVADLRARLAEFARWRVAHLQGDEKGEAQVFLDRLFKAFGHGGVPEAGATLEHRVRRVHGGTSFADLVWKPRVLFEMKKAGEHLERHYQQAFDYWVDLVPDRPKFVVLCNFDELWVYDLNKQVHDPVDVISVADLDSKWEALAFLLPTEQVPEFSKDRVEVTRGAAKSMADLFHELQNRGVARDEAQRFVLQAVLAMFSEDIGLLPASYFTSAVHQSLNGHSSYLTIFGLFAEMNRPGVTKDGPYSGTPYFNGGLLAEVSPFELTVPELEVLSEACKQDWTAVRPAIFGTIFEQAAEHRHAFGQHFTDEADIMRIVGPTISKPWMERIAAATTQRELGRLETELLAYRVLDPACGCGNFLYLAYRELRRVERALRDRRAELSTSKRTKDQASIELIAPSHFYGMDIDPFAVEVAKLTLMLAKKITAVDVGDQTEVLPLDDLSSNFLVADALDPAVQWPAFNACIGNPPYLGRRKLQEERGRDYLTQLDSWYPDVRGVSDYVVYWFRLAHDGLPDGGRAGLVATDSIREGSSKVASLDYVLENGGTITEAVSSQVWSGEAQVHVSLVNWVKGADRNKKLLILGDGRSRRVAEIGANLSLKIDVTKARTLEANKRPKVCHQGQTTGNKHFLLIPTAARMMIQAGDSQDVIRPYFLGNELTSFGEPKRWVIDFGDLTKVLARHVAPRAFAHLEGTVLPEREAAAERERNENEDLLETRPGARLNRHHQNFLRQWWQLAYRRPALMDELSGMTRYIAMSRYAVAGRMSVYAYVDSMINPSDQLMVWTLDDDYSMGVLMSGLHRSWFESLSSLGKAIRYVSRSAFETFPWPQSPSNADARAVATTVSALMQHRDDLAMHGVTLVEMYDSLRTPGTDVLRDLHADLDRQVAAAYGFDRRKDLLLQLMDLNEELADAEAAGREVRGPGPGSLQGVRQTSGFIPSPTL